MVAGTAAWHMVGGLHGIWWATWRWRGSELCRLASRAMMGALGPWHMVGWLHGPGVLAWRWHGSHLWRSSMCGAMLRWELWRVIGGVVGCMVVLNLLLEWAVARLCLMYEHPAWTCSNAHTHAAGNDVALGCLALYLLSH